MRASRRHTGSIVLVDGCACRSDCYEEAVTVCFSIMRKGSYGQCEPFFSIVG